MPRPRRRSAAWIALVVLSAGAVFPLGAQQVRGTVRDSASALPVPGAVVSLLDSAGHATTRAIADERGRFSLPASGAVAGLQAVRIGFRPRNVRLTVPPSAGDVTVDVVMVRLPALLQSVRVSDDALCPGSSDRGDAFTLWEQARAALLATIVARETKPATVRMLTYQRVIYPGSDDIAQQTVHQRKGVSARPFTASRAASEFAAQGYMEETASGRLFSAPDADVLLDESFAATHCLRVVGGDGDHRDQVGLGFEPVTGRADMVDVGGVLWIDRTNPVLRTLEYHYTGLERAAMAAHAGGLLVFRAMSNGVVFIGRWFIRMAALNDYMLSLSQRMSTRRSDRGDLRVVEIEEAGGEVAEAAWPDGLHWEATLGRVTGRVIQRGSGQPVANANVSLTDAGEFSTTTDSAGRFSFAQVLPGPYVIWGRDTSLAAYGVTRTANARVGVERDRASEATIELSSHADLISPLCEGQRAPRGSTIVLGRVATLDGALVSGIAVTAGWQDDSTFARAAPPATSPSWLPVQRSVVSDSTGRFHVCGVPRGRAVQIRVDRNGMSLADAPLQPADDAFRLVSLTIPPIIKP